LKKNIRLEELKIELNIIIIIIILYFRTFLLPLFGIEEEGEDVIYLFHILFPTIFFIILHFKISLLLLFGIEEEEEDIISLLYMFLQTWMKL